MPKEITGQFQTDLLTCSFKLRLKKPCTIFKETPNGQKKKIIPVGSDFEGSPSPEFPSSPAESPKNETNHMTEDDKKNKKGLNFKWKSSVSKCFICLFFRFFILLEPIDKDNKSVFS